MHTGVAQVISRTIVERNRSMFQQFPPFLRIDSQFSLYHISILYFNLIGLRVEEKGKVVSSVQFCEAVHHLRHCTGLHIRRGYTCLKHTHVTQDIVRILGLYQQLSKDRHTDLHSNETLIAQVEKRMPTCTVYFPLQITEKLTRMVKTWLLSCYEMTDKLPEWEGAARNERLTLERRS